VFTYDIKTNPNDRIQLARAAIASAIQLGQKQPLFIGGTDLALAEEAINVCIASGIKYTPDPKNAALVASAKVLKANIATIDKTVYAIENTPSGDELLVEANIQSNIQKCRVYTANQKPQNKPAIIQPTQDQELQHLQQKQAQLQQQLKVQQLENQRLFAQQQAHLAQSKQSPQAQPLEQQQLLQKQYQDEIEVNQLQQNKIQQAIDANKLQMKEVIQPNDNSAESNELASNRRDESTKSIKDILAEDEDEEDELLRQRLEALKNDTEAKRPAANIQVDLPTPHGTTTAPASVEASNSNVWTDDESDDDDDDLIPAKNMQQQKLLEQQENLRKLKEAQQLQLQQLREQEEALEKQKAAASVPAANPSSSDAVATTGSDKPAHSLVASSTQAATETEKKKVDDGSSIGDGMEPLSSATDKPTPHPQLELQKQQQLRVEEAKKQPQQKPSREPTRLERFTSVISKFRPF
jgi:hypothetical protein